MSSSTSFTQFVCLSGMPRSGSTLISSILSQNPLIHAEGNSAVCQLMWDLQKSCCTSSSEQLKANRRDHTVFDLVSAIPHIYYKNIPEKIVVDKCRSWTLEPNVNMLKIFVDTNVKIIVLERPVLDIVKSFVKLLRKNNIVNEEFENGLIKPGSDPIMRSLDGIKWAKENNSNNNFLFIKYDELIESPKEIIAKIYEFCGWEHFEHDFQSITNKYPENDEAYQLKGLHDIRSTLGKVENNETTLNTTLFKKCQIIDKIHNNGYNIIQKIGIEDENPIICNISNI